MDRHRTPAPLAGRAAVLTLLFALLFPAVLSLGARDAHAQDDAPAVTIYGFVKSETIYDTRQVADVREGQFLLFPLADPDPDSDEDAADTDNLLLTAIQTRLGVRGTGAQALGADLTGVIEGDFFGGPTNDNISLFILRHAFVQLRWANREVLFGQYWSPLFTVPVFPGTISFNTGAPFQPFSRQPQVRLTLKPTDQVQVVGAIAGQRDAFAEVGGPKLQQQSGLPLAHLHVRFLSDEVVVGGGAYAKWIRPTLTSERFSAGAVQAYLKYTQPAFYVAGKATYGSDLTDHLLTGGFVQEDTGGADEEYAALDVLSLWGDLGYDASPSVQLGLFVGFLTNEGASDAFTPLDGGVSGLRAPTMESLWRVSPRVVFRAGKFQLAGEVEVTSANYAAGLDEHFAPTGDTNAATNVRGLLAAYYFF